MIFYVARYNPSTNTFAWAVSGGSTGEERALCDLQQQCGVLCYIAGYLSGSMSFGSTNLTAVTAAPEVLVGGLAVIDGAKQWALTASGDDVSLADQARAYLHRWSIGKDCGNQPVCRHCQFPGPSVSIQPAAWIFLLRK